MTEPYEAIPDSTQAHVDRLVGASVDGYRVLARQAEARFGTLYRAHDAAGATVTLEVLRTALVGHDDEARAANAIKCAGIVEVKAFGALPDGRRYRVMPPIDGESLEHAAHLQQGLPAREVVEVLAELALVLEAAHAWAIPHGGLDASCVFRSGGAVRVIDFGLRKGTPADHDLQALGAMGFSLLLGKPLEGAPPPVGARVPAALHRVLLELLENRFASATTVHRDLRELASSLGESASKAALVPVAPPTQRTSRAPLIIGAVVVLLFAGGAALFLSNDQPAVEPEPLEFVEPTAEESEPLNPVVEPSLTPEPTQVPTPTPTPTPTKPKVVPSKVVPTAQALQELTAKFEAQLIKKVRRGDERDQALFVLNKLRLRLTGSPSEADRREVARQLAEWRHSYLR